MKDRRDLGLSLARIKPVLPYAYIPLIIIVCANLLGLLLRLLVTLLARASAFLKPILVEHWGIASVLVICSLPLILSQFTLEIRAPSRRSPSLIKAIAAVILGCITLLSSIVLCVLAYEAASFVFTTHTFKRYNLVFFVMLTLAILQFALRPHTMRTLTWKKLSDLWLKPPTIGAITVGGFGFIATSDTIKNPLLKLTVANEYTNLAIIVPTMLCAVSFMLVAVLAERIGRTRSPDDDGNIPHGWFYTAFGCAFVANVTLFSLLLNSVFLTIQTHYAVRPQSVT